MDLLQKERTLLFQQAQLFRLLALLPAAQELLDQLWTAARRPQCLRPCLTVCLCIHRLISRFASAFCCFLPSVYSPAIHIANTYLLCLIIRIFYT